MRRKILLVSLMALITGVIIGPSVLGIQATNTEIESGGLRVNLTAFSQETIDYKTNNGLELGPDPVKQFEIPHLVLYRNGDLTKPDMRTFRVEITGIAVPPGGATLLLDVSTQHPDFDTNGEIGAVITAWRESVWIENNTASSKKGISKIFTHVFTETVAFGAALIPTPTDYYDLSVSVVGEGASKPVPGYAYKSTPAFLLENQWLAPLPQVPEAIEGAAPDELVVYYCDMFPFQWIWDDPGTRLPREQIPVYMADELVPAMVDAFQVQSETWGFAWMGLWDSVRMNDDQGQLSVAFSDGETWFHGLSAYQGNAGISINPANQKLADYESLTDGILSTFYHEVFHNMQRSINLAYTGNGNSGGLENEWTFFSEGTAVLASSVGQPELQFDAYSERRAYMRNASTFLGLGLISSDLNKSYARVVPHHTAIYWRILYEQCGGWDIIWRSLDVLYAGEIVDPNASTDFLASLAFIMDLALSESTCPFQKYHDSLMAFARAVYSLRVEGERCQSENHPVGCGFYDPNNLYPEPAAAKLQVGRQDQTYVDRINSSYGMDFLEIEIPHEMDGHSLEIEISGEPDSVSTYSVQLLRGWRDGNGGLNMLPDQDGEVRQITQTDRSVSYLLPNINAGDFSILALILVRTDAQEDIDSVGAYTIQLQIQE
jgi:hypothetical protein